LGQGTTLNVTIHGGRAPFTLQSSVAEFAQEGTSQTSFQSPQTPTAETTYRVEVTDADGETVSSTVVVAVHIPRRPELSAEGPLSQALTDLWNKARSAKVQAIEGLVIRLFDAAATWKLHQALATLRDAEVTCQYEVDISAEGIEKFQIEFAGQLAKANALKSFLDPQLRSAAEHNFEATYSVQFTAPFRTTPDQTDTLTKSLTKYGSGEAYVEAQAAPVEPGS